MTQLTAYSASNPSSMHTQTSDPSTIRSMLSDRGISFEQWAVQGDFAPGTDGEIILKAYQEDIQRLQAEEGYETVDVVSMAPDHPARETLRKKFLNEHIHTEDEVRFFVAGQGLFCLHLSDEVLLVRCETGDLIRVPANTKHWFDTGPAPSFIAIRLFTDPDGWIAEYTGDDIASRFPTMDQL